MGKLCDGDAAEADAVLAAGGTLPPVTAGTMCLVRPDDTDHWQRALVQHRLPTSPKNEAWVVRLVDHGRELTIETTHMRPISPELAGLMATARRCELYNVAAPKAHLTDPAREFMLWTEECVELMGAFIAGRSMLMCVVDETDTALRVDLFQPPVWKGASTESTALETHLNAYGTYPPMSLRSTLLFHRHCEESKVSIQHDALGELRNWMQRATKHALAKHNLPPQQPVTDRDWASVHLTHVVSPSQLYLMPDGWKAGSFEPLCKLLHSTSWSLTSRAFQPHIGLICAFSFPSEDGRRGWARATIQKVSRGRCDVYAHDTGEVCSVPAVNLRLLPPDSKALLVPPLALPCRLANVLPARVLRPNGTWTKAANEVVWKAVNDAARITAIPTDGSCPFGVILYADRTCVNRALVDANHAQLVGGKENEMLHKVDLAGGGDSKGQLVVHCPVTRLHVVSSQEIYVRLVDREHDRLEWHERLQDATINGPLSAQDERVAAGCWNIGELCVCYNGFGEGWLRARVVSVIEPNRYYRAFLIDTGETKKFHYRDMSTIPPDFVATEPFAIRCRMGRLGAPKNAINLTLETYPLHAITLGEDGGGALGTSPPTLCVVFWGRYDSQSHWVDLNAQLARQYCSRKASVGSAEGGVSLTLEQAIEAWVQLELQADGGDAIGDPMDPREAVTVVEVMELLDDSGNELGQLDRAQSIELNDTSNDAVSISSSEFDENDFPEQECSTPVHDRSSDDWACQHYPASIERWFPVGPIIVSQGFLASYSNYGDGGSFYLHPQLTDHLQRTDELPRLIGLAIDDQPPLYLWQAAMLEVGSPCLAPYDQDGHYYRAIVTQTDAHDEHCIVRIEERQARVLFVDYLNTAIVRCGDLRKCPAMVRKVPLRNIAVRLVGVRANPRLVEQDVMERVVYRMCQAEHFYAQIVRIVEPGRKLEVRLYVNQCMDELLYQELIDQGYLVEE
uniref:Tudor domain-containing protein n=1 Tax=Anopheles farauti TaxID=69004 RepID=A0A182QC93_9DIPT